MLGINVKRSKFFSYLICGLLAGISGFIFLTHTGAGNATNATAAEMNAIASSIIGGTLLTGGVGNVIGSFFGVLINGTISSLVKTNGKLISSWSNVVSAMLLCFFIVLQAVFTKIKKSRKL